MASDIAIAPARARTEQWLVEAAFVVFLLLVFVGLTPFASRNPAILRLGESGTTGGGDIMRQVTYLGAFLTLAFGAFQKYGARALTHIPALLALLLAWCVMSSLWAAEPGVTFRRAGLEVIIALSAIWGIETLGIERSLKILRFVLAGILIVNWISVPLTHNAIHQPGELDPGLVGAWRGLYYHKNIAGSVTAISALVFLFFAVDQKSRIDWLLFFAAVVFVVMTKSKSSLGLLPVAILAGFVYRTAWRTGLDRSIAAISALLLVMVVTTVAFLDLDSIVRIISDPQEFTGRTAIWQAEFAFIADHTIFGAGFGSFADTGGVSPLHNYVSGDWIEAIAHGHNGYIQLLTELGIVGFALGIGALVLQPAYGFWRRDATPLPFKAFLFSLFVFMVAHNVMESDFPVGDSTWVSLLMLIAMLRQAKVVSESGRT